MAERNDMTAALVTAYTSPQLSLIHISEPTRH